MTAGYVRVGEARVGEMSSLSEVVCSVLMGSCFGLEEAELGFVGDDFAFGFDADFGTVALLRVPRGIIIARWCSIEIGVASGQ